MSQNRLTAVGGHLRLHWRRVCLMGVGTLLVVMLIVQLTYPWANAAPGQRIEGMDVGGKNVGEMTELLDNEYDTLKLDLYFGNSPKPYRQPTLGDLGIAADTTGQAESATYSWYLRLVPTSLWWAQAVIQPEKPQYTHDTSVIDGYITKELGESCDVKPVNATLVYEKQELRVVPAIDGGTCILDDVKDQLTKAEPRLRSSDIRVPMSERPAKIRDEQAKQAAERLKSQTKAGVGITANGQLVEASQKEVLGWLDFAASDTGIVATVSKEQSKEFFSKQLLPKVAIAPGTSQVTTLNFTEISRMDAPAGRTLNTNLTIESLNAWLADSSKRPVAQTMPVPPNVNYTRTYTPTDEGLTALVTQYAQSHPGTFGVSFAELDGSKRRAVYEDTKVFRTASTYKLFVAYGALKRIESGAWHWTDQIHGGRPLSKCLDDMIVKSDNPCGEAMLEKIGFRTLTNELKAIGLTRSSFLVDFPKTTAGDLTTFVGALQAGQLLSPSNTSTLLSAMKRNIYRQGVPAGANGQTADKVGFLDAFLHDAAIVYGPSGTYALTIMTEGSSWGAIADLTRQIEKLRAQG